MIYANLVSIHLGFHGLYAFSLFENDQDELALVSAGLVAILTRTLHKAIAVTYYIQNAQLR